MDLPRVNPIGIVESPADYEASPRRLPVALRLVAAVLLIAFTGVATVTTVASLGAYCLTSYAAMPMEVPALVERITGGSGIFHQELPGSEQHGVTSSAPRRYQVQPVISGT